MGLSATFLALGTRHVVASVVPVPDAETAPLMIAFHRLLAAGQPPTSALARAQQQLGHGQPGRDGRRGRFREHRHQRGTVRSTLKLTSGLELPDSSSVNRERGQPPAPMPLE